MPEYQRYQLTYPHTGRKIYQSSSIEKAKKKCYKEFKEFSGIKEGMFSVTNLDTNETTTYRTKKKSKKKELEGGSRKDNYVDFLNKVNTLMQSAKYW